MTRVTTAWWGALAAVGLVIATPVVTWWVYGDQSEDVAHPAHLLRPLNLGAAAERLAGTAAAGVAVAGAVVLGWAMWRRRFSRRWVPTVVMLVIAGIAFGVGWRVLTAGVAGVSRAAGLVLLFGLPAFVGLVGAAIVVGLVRRPDARHPREPRRRWGRRRHSKRTHIRDETPVSSADRV